jgi:hypothetical protein
MTFFTLFARGSAMSAVKIVCSLFHPNVNPAWEQEGSAWPLSK